MDPRRQKIYIIVIVTCVVLSIVVIVWSKYSTPSVNVPSNQVITARPTTAASASGDYATGFKAPSVFPITDKFNTDVLTTPTFQSLQTYTPIGVVTELGRPDPFNKY